jgi:hypothetical protein
VLVADRRSEAASLASRSKAVSSPYARTPSRSTVAWSSRVLGEVPGEAVPAVLSVRSMAAILPYRRSGA